MSLSGTLNDNISKYFLSFWKTINLIFTCFISGYHLSKQLKRERCGNKTGKKCKGSGRNVVFGAYQWIIHEIYHKSNQGEQTANVQYMLFFIFLQHNIKKKIIRRNECSGLKRDISLYHVILKNQAYLQQIQLGWALFVTYTIIQSIMRREMCSLHLTHPSVHTPGAVGSRLCSA